MASSATIETSTNQKTQLLTWIIDDQLFGLDVKKCREVDRDMRITEVPHSKKYIAGIVNLRGDVVTVLDLRTLLGYAQPEVQSNKNVIIRLKTDKDNTNTALVADRISDIVELDKSQIEPAGIHLNETETKYINFVGILEKGLVLILNSNELLNIK